MSVPNAPVRRHSRERGNPVPFTSCADTQRHWIPDIATRFRDDDKTQSANNLKSGWVVAPISEIADHCLGKMLDKQKNKGVLRPYLRNLNVRWFGFDLSDVLQMRFEEGEVDRYQAKKGDLIICEGGYPGRAAVWESDDPICLQKALHRVRFREPERAKWVLYWLCLLDMSGTLTESFTGAGIQHFTKVALARLKVPLPPLDEQKRIVAVLDQAFAALDRARANAEENLRDVELLFKASVEALLQANRLSWTQGTFGELVGDVSTGPFGSLLHKSDYVENAIPIINPSNIIAGRIEPDWNKTVSAEAAIKLASYTLMPGDLVIGRRGEMGRCATVLKSMEGWLCGTGSFRIRPKDRVSSEFVGRLLRTPEMTARLTAIGTGTTMLNLSNHALAGMQFELPSFEEQLRLAVQINQLEKQAGVVCTRIKTKLTDLAALRQSLLQAAFSGQLS